MLKHAPQKKKQASTEYASSAAVFTGGIIAATKFEVATGLTGLVPLTTSRRSITQTRRRRPFRPSPMSLHVISLSLASPAPSRTVDPKVPVPERGMRSRNALTLSVTRAPQKDGFLRRERRFDVVSYVELAPYFTVEGSLFIY